ncbi:uncharacterized protein TNCV_267321 [Trichonephila clavipes]|nr:uncharacterized protein TNCV_267321 [Trichonephila clavipes]
MATSDKARDSLWTICHRRVLVHRSTTKRMHEFLVPQPNASPSIPSVSTSSSTTQTNILPSASSIKPTTEIESRLPEPISSAAAPDNSLNTSASSLSAETCPVSTISNKFAALQPSVRLSESATTTPNSELSNASKVPQNVKQNSKNRRKRTKSRNRNKNG